MYHRQHKLYTLAMIASHCYHNRRTAMISFQAEQYIKGNAVVDVWTECAPSENFDFSHESATLWCIFIRGGTKFKSITRAFYIGVNNEGA